MKVFYAEISYRTMGWLNLGDDIWALYPQVWPTWPTGLYLFAMLSYSLSGYLLNHLA